MMLSALHVLLIVVICMILEANVQDGIITTIAGTGNAGSSGDGGPAISALLYYPCSVAVDASGNVYIADRVNNKIRMVSI